MSLVGQLLMVWSLTAGASPALSPGGMMFALSFSLPGLLFSLRAGAALLQDAFVLTWQNAEVLGEDDLALLDGAARDHLAAVVWPQPCSSGRDWLLALPLPLGAQAVKRSPASG